LITADGNEVKNLTGTSLVDETSPAWSPVADEIVFVRTFSYDHHAAIVLYDLKRGEGDVILRHDDIMDIKGLQWSQDDGKIAFYNDAEFNGGIYVIDRSGSELTRYTNKGLIFDWIYP
jgi:Tol biopolymer transport system component